MTKVQATKVIGIDASTKSIAFAIFDGGKPVRCGEIQLNGSTIQERLMDAKRKVRELVRAGILDADYIALEAAIKVNSPETAISLAYVYGAILSELGEVTTEVHKVYPISWQTGIGVPNLKKDEKEKIKADNPDRKPSWYANEGRKIRKARILAVAREYFKIADGSDNVGDAVGIAKHVSESLTRR